MTKLARHLDLPPLHLHQRPSDRKAKASATNPLCGRIACPVEAGEKPGLLLCGEPDARIGDGCAGNGSDSLNREVMGCPFWNEAGRFYALVS